MYTDILKETKIIVIILRAAPVVTVARTIIIAAWDIFRSIAMVMAVPILTSIGMKTTMIAVVAMTMQPRSITIMSMMRSIRKVARVGIAITTKKQEKQRNTALAPLYICVEGRLILDCLTIL